jgi:uncharacterized protein YndB with AHSA1/START domain
MTRSRLLRPDPKLDLVLERVVDVPRELVWDAWTKPEHIKVWFTPRPWRTTECEIDLRPGGIFRTVMRGPAGEEFNNIGCYLEVVPQERLVWTDTLLPGWRPAASTGSQSCGLSGFTAVVALETLGQGTRYIATAMHRDEAGRRQHEEMGFYDGWGKALDQLVAHVRTMC